MERLGRYHILGPLGQGGMGVVYRAYDPELQREIALKVLPEEATGDRTARARLLREARLLSALNHPNICIVHDVGEHDGAVFIAMERIEGESLEARITAAPLDPAMATRLGADIAAALAHAHRRGIVHRDLKSANVMVTAEDRAKVLDFGLGRLVQREREVSRTTLTATGMVMGTPDYIAPEVLQGAEADARADVWALGVVLHEMLAGERPFHGRSATQTLAAVLQQPPAPLPAGVPGALARVVARCLEKEPARRFQSAEEVKAALESGAASPAMVGPRTARGRWWPAAAVSFAAVTAVVLAWVWLRPTPRIGALAVLPLENLSGDPHEEYFADGMTDELTTTLAKLGELRVIARSSVMRFKHSTMRVRAIARQLGVDVVVEGSVVHAGNEVRVTAQLVRAASEQNMWAESYERPLGDVLALQGDVAQAIAQQVRLKLSPARRQSLARARAVNPQAYQLYLRGRVEWDAYNPHAFERALRDFEQSVAIDSTFAPTWAGIADCWWAMSSQTMDPQVAMPRARLAAERAVALDPNVDEAHVALGTVARAFDWNWARADSEYRVAIALNQNSAAAHREYAYVFRILGQFAEDSSEQSRAALLDPLSDATLSQNGWPQYFGRRYAQARDAFERTLQRAPQLDSAHSGLALTLDQLGRYDEALREAGEAWRIGRAGVYLCEKAHILAAMRRTAEARALADSLQNGLPGSFVALSSLAPVYVSLGQPDEALRVLERGVAARDDWTTFIKVDPQLDPLRSEPRFRALVAKMGL
jgi:eukaryotic-like serine/threonine-protein kinase